MSQITDNSGKSWSLMSCKDSAGRVYIRAYRNRWDAEKKRSCVDARIQVGRLLDDAVPFDSRAPLSRPSPPSKVKPGTGPIESSFLNSSSSNFFR